MLVQRIAIACLVTSCMALTGIAVFRTTNAARYPLTPEETTLLLVYGFLPGDLKKTGGVYLMEWSRETPNGPILDHVMTVRRNQGCRVELERSSPDPVDSRARNVKIDVFDWSQVEVDKITVTQETVPNQGYEAYYRTIIVPGNVQGTRVLRRSDHGVEVVRAENLSGPIEFQKAYAPDQLNAYEIARQPLLDLVARCTGHMPELPDAKRSSRTYPPGMTEEA